MPDKELADEPILKLEEQQSSANANSEADRYFRFLDEKSRVLIEGGMSARQATDTAMLEYRVSQWPPEWGNDLIVILYGDFSNPLESLDFPEFGITIEPEEIKASVVVSAICVLKARVRVKSKSISGLNDAAERINTFLGICSAINWGNSGSGWWSIVTHGTLHGGIFPFDHEKIIKIIEHMNLVDDKIIKKNQGGSLLD